MRWKLLCVTSLAAAVVGFVIWFAFILVTFGSAQELARTPIWFAVSLSIPLALCVSAGLFAYRHTSKRRKFQALMTVLLTLLLTTAVYVVASIFWHSRVYIPRTFEVRQPR